MKAKRLKVKEGKRLKRGQSLYEVVFALGVTALILTGVVSLAATTVRNSTFTRNNAQATKYVQEATEWLRGERDADWDVFIANVAANSTYCLDDSPLLNYPNPSSWSNPGICGGSEFIGFNTIFLRQVSFDCLGVSCSSPTVDTVEATVSVSWDDAQGTHEVKAITRFTNWLK